MASDSGRRWLPLALGALALGGWFLRAAPLLEGEGAVAVPVDYDEGVYFAAAAALLDGDLPYRDFVFVHPPGHLVFLALSSAWTTGLVGVAQAFALSRWVATILGALAVFLTGSLVHRLTGHAAATLLSAALHATYPEAVVVGHGPFLEPLLNLACLGLVFALVVASETAPGARHRALTLGGLCAGLALSIKLWAVLWWMGAAAALVAFASPREALTFFRAALVTALVVVLPFALTAPGAFVTEVVGFHVVRPPDGLTDRLPRLEQIVAARHLASPLLALLFVARTVARPLGTSAAARAMCLVWPLTVGAFIASSSYWAQYNAHLIASEAVLAGLALAWLLEAGSPRPRFVLVFFVVLVSVGLSVLHTIIRFRGSREHLVLARSPLAASPDCVFTFEPGWALVANRLPPRLDPGPRLIDPYASQLLDAMRGGQRFSSADEAFASNTSLPRGLESCRTVVAGERGRRQLSQQAIEALERTHQRRAVGGLVVWEQRPPREGT